MSKKPYVAPDFTLNKDPLPQTLTDEELVEIFLEQFGGLN